MSAGQDGLDVRGVSKAYGSTLANQEIDLQVAPGTVHVLLGENGAGKSTLVNLINGREAPDAGEIRFAGALVAAPGHTRPNPAIATVHQDLALVPVMTGLENIRFVARVYGQDTEAVIDYVREFSELGESLKLPVKTYSSGMKARLAFGMSLALDFDCYLIDEVTAVGDERFKKKSRKAFQEKLPHSRIIMVSHSKGQVKEYCDCGIYLSGGNVEFFDDVDELFLKSS